MTLMKRIYHVCGTSPLSLPDRGLLRFCCAWVICAFLISPIFAAAPLKNYTDRLAKAETVVDDLVEGSHSAVEVMNAMATLRRLLPQREDVMFEGQVVRIDNSWLHEKIDDVIKGVNGDVEQRRSMLTEISDRLFFLQERVTAQQSQQNLKTDDRREQLDRILARPEYRSEEQKESAIRRLLRRILEAIVRFLSRFGSTPGREPSGVSSGTLTGFRILIVLLLIAASIFGIMQLMRRIKRRRKSEDEIKTREVLGEEIAEDATAADLLARAADLAREGDYRAAIRRAYIALLFELEQHGKLRLHRSKTNRDYLDSLRSETRIFPVFSSMTGTFEQVWYGQMRATEDEFNGFLSRYRKTTEAEREKDEE